MVLAQDLLFVKISYGLQLYKLLLCSFCLKLPSLYWKNSSGLARFLPVLNCIKAEKSGSKTVGLPPLFFSVFTFHHGCLDSAPPVRPDMRKSWLIGLASALPQCEGRTCWGKHRTPRPEEAIRLINPNPLITNTPPPAARTIITISYSGNEKYPNWLWMSSCKCWRV